MLSLISIYFRLSLLYIIVFTMLYYSFLPCKAYSHMESRQYANCNDGLQTVLQIAWLFLFIPYGGVLAGMHKLSRLVKSTYHISQAEIIAWWLIVLWAMLGHWLSLSEYLF